MTKTIRRLPDRELELMQIVWRSEPPVSRVQIEREMAKTSQLAATTILTFLSRLCEKGFLSAERSGRTNRYTPLVSERDYLAAESRSMLDRLYGGSLAAFAAALCDGGVSREEVAELKDLLERGAL